MSVESLELSIERILDVNEGIRKTALDQLHKFIRENLNKVSTEQMKLYDCLAKLKKVAEKAGREEQRYLFDFISILSMDGNDTSLVDVVKYRVMGNVTLLKEWGHQYVKQLIKGCNLIRHGEITVVDYTSIVDPICYYLYKHNCEVEAIDFLLEISSVSSRCVGNLCPVPSTGFIVDKLDLIEETLDRDNFERVYDYLVETSRFYPLEELLLKITKDRPTRHLVHLINQQKTEEAINFTRGIENPSLRKQCLYILARCNIYYETEEAEEAEILENKHIKKFYMETAKDLEVLPCWKLEKFLRDLTKEKVETLCITNSLIHMGYCRDTLFMKDPTDHSVKADLLAILSRSQDLSTIEMSVGLVTAFNHENLLATFSEEIFNNKELSFVIAMALSSYKDQSTNEKILPLLSKYLSSEKEDEVLKALFGLVVLYAGAHSADTSEVFDRIFPLLTHSSVNVVLMTVFLTGVLYMGKANSENVVLIRDVLASVNPAGSSFYAFAILGVGFLFYRRPDLADKQEFLKLDEPFFSLALGFMYFSKGDTSVIERILENSLCGERNGVGEIISLVSISLVAFGDPVATESVMSLLINAENLNTKRINNTIPLCLSLLSPSSCDIQAIEKLEKFISNKDLYFSSIIGLGVLGAGSNSNKINRILSSNLNFFSRDDKAANGMIFAQGLISLGKGMLTLEPTAYHGMVVSEKALTGLLMNLCLFVDPGLNFFKSYNFMLYSIMLAVSPKYIVGIESDVKVGTPVQTVGLAGNPKKISGTTVFNLPVLLQHNQCAEVSKKVLSYFIEDVLVEDDE